MRFVTEVLLNLEDTLNHISVERNPTALHYHLMLYDVHTSELRTMGQGAFADSYDKKLSRLAGKHPVIDVACKRYEAAKPPMDSRGNI